jgi:hypothetical protein
MAITPAGSYIDNSGGSSGLSNPNVALTGVPTAPTAALGTNTTQIATTAFVTASIAAPAFIGRGRETLISANSVSQSLDTNGDASAASASAFVNLAATTTASPALGGYQNSANTVVAFAGQNLNYVVGRNLGWWFDGFTSRITDQRIWVGLTDQSAGTQGISGNPAGKYAAFRWSTIDGDTSWQCITKDGSTQTVVSSGVAPVANASQTFAMIFADSVPNITFYINGAVVATISTHLPPSATILRWVMTEMWAVSIVNSEMYISQMRIRSDF